MADLNPKEVEKAKLVFDIYDFEGIQKIDAFHLGDALRALELSPTNGTVEKNGGTKKKGEKQLALEEFLPIFSQVKKEKDCGSYADFIEVLKLYDKAENGTILAAELAHVLLSLGEKLSDGEVENILKIAGPEDEDGYIKYEPWVKNLIAGPFPKEEEA